jgi:DNA-binding MarR family transcriptional regulator
MSPPDAVVHLVEQWRTERPDLDGSPLLVLGRILRLAALVDPLLRPPMAAAGLASGDFDVLAALRRVGAPYALTPGELSVALLVSTGAVTKRVDRLVARGLVTRRTDENDARGRWVSLTPPGRSLTDRLIAEHLANEERILAGLSHAQRSSLARLLGTLAEHVESL